MKAVAFGGKMGRPTHFQPWENEHPDLSLLSCSLRCWCLCDGFNHIPPLQKLRRVEVLTPRTSECDLIWKHNYCGCDWLRQSYWSRVGPQSNVTGVLIKREMTQRQTDMGEGGHGRTEAETGEVHPQAKDCWQTLKLGEARKGAFLRVSERRSS